MYVLQIKIYFFLNYVIILQKKFLITKDIQLPAKLYNLVFQVSVATNLW